MTGVRRLAWRQDYRIHTHSWRIRQYERSMSMQPTLTFVCTCPHAHDRHAIKHTHTHTRITQDISFHKSGNYTVNTAQITSMSRGIIFGVGKSTFALMRFHNFLRQKLHQVMFKLSDVIQAVEILWVGFCLRLGRFGLGLGDVTSRRRRRKTKKNKCD